MTQGEPPKKLVQATQPGIVGLSTEQFQAIVANAVQQAMKAAPAPAVTYVGGKPGNGSVISPESSAQAQGISFEDYCLDEETECQRPYFKGGNVIDVTTFKDTQKHLRQLQREGVPVDPPSWDVFMAWVNSHPKGKAGCNNQRKAYVRLCGYYGVQVPVNGLQKWDTVKAVTKGRRSGKLTVRERFFRNGPWDVLRLMRAEPYRDDVYNDAFHHAVVLSTLTGPRSGEPTHLRVQDMQASTKGAKDWMQTKKMTERSIHVPEPWFWDGPGPTVKWYLERVRPRLVARSGYTGDAYFLNSEGRPFHHEDAAIRTALWSKFMREPAKKTLEYTIGSHAYRRLCASLRYTWGWTLSEVAQHLDDNESTVDTHYIDHAWVRTVRRRNLGRRIDSPPPVLPPIWNLPKALDLEPPALPEGGSA